MRAAAEVALGEFRAWSCHCLLFLPIWGYAQLQTRRLPSKLWCPWILLGENLATSSKPHE